MPQKGVVFVWAKKTLRKGLDLFVSCFRGISQVLQPNPLPHQRPLKRPLFDRRYHDI